MIKRSAISRPYPAGTEQLRLFLNERSLAALDRNAAIAALVDLLRARARYAVLRANLHCARNLPSVRLADGFDLRTPVQSLDPPTRRQLFAWTAAQGPFYEDLRAPIDDDLFFFENFEVTDEGLGEAARQYLGGHSSAAFSVPPAYTQTPLSVLQGFADEPVAIINVNNYWDASVIAAQLEKAETEATNWVEMLEQCRARFPSLVIGRHCDTVLARQPFEPIVSRRVFVLLGVLNRLVEETGADGAWTEEGQRLYTDWCTGERARFSDESEANKRDFASEMTFPDPLGEGPPITCFWHGKIQTPQFRIHYEWPIPAPFDCLRIAYIGPKISKR